MKKCFVLVCILASIISLSACGTNKGAGLNEKATLYTVSEEWKKDSVKNVAGMLNELVNDKEFVSAMAYGEIADYCEILQATKIDKSKSAKVYKVRDDVIENVLNMSGASIDDFSDVAKKRLEKTGVSTIGSQVVSSFGVSAIALYSSFQISETYAIDKAFGNQLWIIPTDNESVYILATVISTDELYPLCTISCGYVYSSNTENIMNVFERALLIYGMEAVGVKMD